MSNINKVTNRYIWYWSLSSIFSRHSINMGGVTRQSILGSRQARIGRTKAMSEF